MSTDLDYSQQRSFNLGVAMDVTIEAAMIYDDLVYAQKIFGKGYFYRSYDMMMQRFPMLSLNTIRRHVARLEKAGYISTKIQKVNGSPVCHYQIEIFLSTKMRDSMENAKMRDSINKETKKETKPATFLFGGNSYSAADGPAALLAALIAVVNPREKATDDRLRKLSGRLKEYTGDEILGAAHAFAQSKWHRDNGQMSIDNLLAPSKFGRWYAQRSEQAPTNIGEMESDSIFEGTPFPVEWPKAMEQREYDEDDNLIRFRGIRLSGKMTTEYGEVMEKIRERDNGPN